MRPQAISVGDANAVHFLLALTSGGSQQLAASEQESGDRVRVEGSYRRRHSKALYNCLGDLPLNTGLAHGGTGRRAHPLRAMHRQAAAFARGEVLTGEERESSHRDPSIFSSSTAQPLASTSARIDLLTVDGSRLPRPGARRIIIQSTSPWCRTRARPTK